MSLDKDKEELLKTVVRTETNHLLELTTMIKGRNYLMRKSVVDKGRSLTTTEMQRMLELALEDCQYFFLFVEHYAEMVNELSARKQELH